MLKPRRKKRLVLDIGTSAIRLAELSPTKEGYQLSKFFQKETVLEPGTGDEERLQAQLTALNELLKESKSRRRKAVIAVPGQSVFTRNRPLPPVPEHKVSQIVRYEIQQQIPFSLDQIALDYEVLDRNEAGGYEVMMTAIKVDVVEKQLELLKRAKCSVEIVDVSPIAAYNWIEHTGEFGDDDQCVALIDLGATTTDIVVRKDGQFKFTRSLHTGGNDITQAIAREFNMSYLDAERLKRERGFAPTGDPKRDGKGGEVIGRVLNRLVGEINRSLAYFRSQPGGGAVQRVILVGGGACLRNIVPYLQRMLNVEVRIAQPLAGLAVSPSAQAASEHPERSCVALGLALRTVEEPKVSINLIPPRVRAVARQKEQLIYWVLTMVALVLILGARIPLVAKQSAQAEQRIEQLKQILAQYDPALVASPTSPSEFEDELTFVINDVRKHVGDLKYLDSLRRGRGTWIDQLLAVADARPPGGGVVIASIETAVFGGPRNTGDTARKAARDQLENPPKEPGELVYAASNEIIPFPGVEPPVIAAAGMGRAKKQAKPARTDIVEPNAFMMYGYAKDLDTLRRFVDNLAASGAFVPGGVYWHQAYTDNVDCAVLDAAPQRGTRKVRGGSGGAALPDCTVLQFSIDVQFLGDPLVPEELAKAKEKLK